MDYSSPLLTTSGTGAGKGSCLVLYCNLLARIVRKKGDAAAMVKSLRCLTIGEETAIQLNSQYRPN
jgi:hypothetical protein